MLSFLVYQVHETKRPAPKRRGAFILERLMGVEPTCRAWEARILPMNYSREKGMTQGSLASFLVGRSDGT